MIKFEVLLAIIFVKESRGYLKIIWNTYKTELKI